ncbi:hypothetical protein THRCLA_21438 [Thraustotheca clavata]|uniref:CBM1 domain-containing protein n=1 Tax=Thraustotheca clavata TaxID=74557 RepID=A0A1V9ZWM7_9STRA|nr:hypothetical protein THRCLA_21438 [Thraustotheca clavata]
MCSPQGNVCGDNGDLCPKKGDIAVADCIKTLKSYVSAGKCVAPSDATYQTVKKAKICPPAPEVPSSKSPVKLELMDVEDDVVPIWQKCGGKGNESAASCTAGSPCIQINDYYYQCQPTPPKNNEFATWSQCGGAANNFNPNGMVCREGDVCTKYSDTYSQCVPKQ